MGQGRERTGVDGQAWEEREKGGGKRTLVIDVLVDHPSQVVVPDKKILDEELVDCERSLSVQLKKR
jgi:hypothetical protein